MSNEKPSGEVFEMCQKMINPMSFPLQSLMMGALNPEELEKKINELTTVKYWLSTNVSMLELTIKTLEYQKALVTPAKEGAPKPGSMAAGDNPMMNPALWPWAMMGMEKPAEGSSKGTPTANPFSSASTASSATAKKTETPKR